MTVYIILMLGILVAGILCFSKGESENNTKIFCNISLFMMLIVQCLRGNGVGEDTAAYIDWFNEYCDMSTVTSFLHPWRDIDVGYSILNIVISRFTTNEHALIIVVSILIVLLHIKFIQKTSKDSFVSVMLFLGCNFFITSMVSWRQFIAMGMVVWMYPLLLEKKYIKALFVMALAFCFHDTAIFVGGALLVSVLLANDYKSSWLILLLGIAFIPMTDIFVNKILTFLPAYQLYFNGAITNDASIGIGKLRWVYLFTQFYLMIIILLVKKYHTQKITVMSSLMAFAIVIGLLGMFVPYVFRISYYFDYFMLILIPELLPKKSRYGLVIKIGITFFSMALYVYYLSYNPGQTVPYKFCF